MNELIDKFERNRKNQLLEDLIKNVYMNYNLPGTSFINYNFTENSLTAYLVDKRTVIVSPIVNYLFLGIKAKEIDDFYFKDVNHSLIPTLIHQHKKHEDYIWNIFDIWIFQDKTPILMKANLS